MEDLENFSCALSDCMDLSGYSSKMITHRQETNSLLDQIYNRNISPITKVSVLTTGGKGEGTNKYFESDIDRLYTHGEMVCLDSKGVQTGKKDYVYKGLPMTIFLSNPDGCSPGYTRLELLSLRQGRFTDTMKASLVKEGSKVYLRNDFPKLPRESTLYDINGMPIDKHKRSGPSRSASNLDISYDFVHGIAYDSQRFLEEWSKRARKYDWPSPDLIKTILDTKSHVVPVASKITEYLQTEWRICCTEAELLLLRSLNEYQIKILILLKLVSKFYLQPVTKEVSSYIVKNVTFWIAEMKHSSLFTRETLFERFLESLCFLRDSLSEGRLVSFIIIERNLLEGRISKSQARQLADVIDNLVSEKAKCLLPLNIGPVFDAMKNSPEEQEKKSIKRDQAEILLLRRNVAFKKIECASFEKGDLGAFPEMLANDADWKQLGAELNNLVVPNFQGLQDSGIDTFDIYKENLLEMLS